ncbi:MAG: hypothetical protein ACTSU6_06470 [Candidatus Njordarchaeales archaeon]
MSKRERSRDIIKHGYMKNFLELIVVISLAAYYLYLLSLGQLFSIWILGLLLGFWLILRPAWVIIPGVRNLSKKLGMTKYSADTIISFLVLLAEVSIVIFLAYFSNMYSFVEFVTISYLYLLYAASLNILILGLLVAIKGGKFLSIPDEVFSRELEIIDWTVMATLLISFLGFIKYLKSGGYIVSDIIMYLPRFSLIILPMTYISYLKHLWEIKKDFGTFGTIEPEISVVKHIIMIFLANVGFIIGGLLLAYSSVSLITYYSNIYAFGDVTLVISFFLGLIIGLREVIISQLLFAKRGQPIGDIGSLIGSVIQLVMVLIGILGILLPIPLSKYIIYELITVGLGLWFLRMAISDDKRLDPYEGIMLFLLQAFALLLSLEGF